MTKSGIVVIHPKPIVWINAFLSPFTRTHVLWQFALKSSSVEGVLWCNG